MAHYETNKLKDMTLPMSEEFTLYVSDLPSELNKQGLLQVFNHYGHIKGLLYRPNANWAYITYGSYLEAENAIRDLNNVPPLRLKISFAKEKNSSGVHFQKVSDSKDISKEIETHNALNPAFINTPVMKTNEYKNPIDILKNVKQVQSLSYTVNDDLLYPYPADLQTYNPYENSGPYASTNRLWTRGQLTISQDGKRHVYLGRGHTMYDISYPEPEVSNQINKVYEKRASGVYEYGNDMLQNGVGLCKTCSRKSKFTCEKCNTFYCSRQCQLANWPKHKFECETIPALVPTEDSTFSLQVSSEEHTPIRNTSNIQVPLRRPKKLNQALTTADEANKAIIKEQGINIKCTSNSKKNADKEFKHNHALKEDVNSENCDKKNSEASSKINNLTKNRTFNADDVQRIESDIAFGKSAFLSEMEFTNVKIIVKQNREFWVQRVKDEPDIIKLMTSLQNEASMSQKVTPVIGKIYAVNYEGIWHRALVTSLNPLTVHYIDYGNDECITTNDFREIRKLIDVPRFSAKIRLSENAYKQIGDLRYEDILSVKMLSVDSNKVIDVKVEGEDNVFVPTKNDLYNKQKLDISATTLVENTSALTLEASENMSTPRVDNKVNNIFDTMFVGERGILEIHVKVKNNVYSITILPHNAISDYEKLLTDLPNMCVNTAEQSNHNPKVGEIICGERVDGDWLRGYILSLTSPLKMAIIDEARIMPITKTVACPENFLQICAFGAICEVSNAKCEFSPGDQYEFEVVGKGVNNGPDKIEIEISKNDDTFKAIVKAWEPVPEQKGIQYAELNSGSEVCLTAFESHTHLFARPLDTHELEHYNYVMQNVAKCSQTSQYLKDAPVVGQMIIAEYTDGNFYRAIVTKIVDDKIVICYVDFGNHEITNIKKLKNLSDDLKQLRSCTSKIVLKDVPKNIPMTKEVGDYLSLLIGAETPLICTFEGVPSKDGVCLKCHNGENINKKISELLASTTKESAENDKTCFMADCLSFIDLGEVGDVVEVLVLHSIEDSYKYAICPLDYDLIAHVSDIMPAKMKAYCESSDYYIPRENELCLALYKGGWYRAECILRTYTPTESVVFFIDFGNTECVSHKDIRLMPKEFTTPNALANICKIINIAPTNQDGQFSSKIEKRISQLVVPESIIRVKIIERDNESGIYCVELPLIRDKLNEEGLLSA